MKTLATFLLVAAALLLAACGGARAPSVGAPDEGGGDGGGASTGAPDGTWRLTSGHAPAGEVPILDTHPITLAFDDGQVGGTAACNHYGGQYDLGGDALTIVGLAHTEMACEPAAAMEAERVYLEALQRVDTFTHEGDALTLSGPDVELVFERLPPPPTADVVGTTWHLETLLVGTGPDGTASSAAPAELLLAADGTLAGSTGCRQLSGEWVEADGGFATPSLTASGDCTAALAEQDAHVIAVLEGTFTASVDGTTLTLTNAELGLVYRAGEGS